MIDEADRDGDGEIGEEEFMRIMKKTNLFWSNRISLLIIMFNAKFSQMLTKLFFIHLFVYLYFEFTFWIWIY